LGGQENRRLRTCGNDACLRAGPAVALGVGGLRIHDVVAGEFDHHHAEAFKSLYQYFDEGRFSRIVRAFDCDYHADETGSTYKRVWRNPCDEKR
jgi:hypothetical protein